MKSLIKRIGVAITCVAIACSALLTPAAAASLRGITIYMTGSDVTYMVLNEGTFKDQSFIFTDGNSKAVWRLPLAGTATVATLVADVAANYTLEVSADNANWVTWAKAAGGEGVGEMSAGNRTEEVLDITNYIPNGQIFVRLGDQTTANGWGGNLFSLKLKYYKYETEVIEPIEYKDLEKKSDTLKNILGGGNFNFLPGTKLEKHFFVDGVGGGTLSGRSRFMDHTATLNYRIPVDPNREFFLNLVLAANYTVKVSTDNKYFYLLDAAEGGKNKDEFGPENKGMRSYNSKTDIAKALAQGDQILSEENPYLYVRIGDQTTGSGWGGQVFYVGLHYGKTNGVYDPFITKGIKSTAVRYKRPQRVMTYKTVTTKTPIETTPIIDDGAWDVDDLFAEEPVESIEQIEEIPVEDTQIDAVTDNTTSEEQPADTTPEAETNSGIIWYIVIGVIALILIGGAVTQFILMEKKRKANAGTNE